MGFDRLWRRTTGSIPGREAFRDTAEAVRAELAVNAPGDEYEREADRVAEQIPLGPEPQLRDGFVYGQEDRRHCAARPCPRGRRVPISRVRPDGGRGMATPSIVHEVLAGAGQSLDKATRRSMETLFGHDFADVRVYADAKAVRSARAVNALAYTVGRSLVFGEGQYPPGTTAQRRLMAHELTHVIQQDGQPGSARLQRQNVCSNPNFCKPYPTPAEAASKKAWMRKYFLPVMGVKFGTEVFDLWAEYLSRVPGASLTRKVFETPGNPIEESFATSSATDKDQDAVLDLVIDRVSLLPGGALSPHVHTVSSLSNYLSPGEMNNRPINYSNPLSKAGNIAGDIGSSDAGPDSRKIARANVAMEKVPVIGDAGYIKFQLFPHYEVYDAIDFCPGQCGSPAEQVFTVPLSRLEASGEAYDVPYVVRFRPEPRTKREFYSSFPV